jgi:hypothetical protein
MMLYVIYAFRGFKSLALYPKSIRQSGFLNLSTLYIDLKAAKASIGKEAATGKDANNENRGNK